MASSWSKTWPVVLAAVMAAACTSPAKVGADKTELIQNGDALLKKGEALKAVAAYQAALEIDPSDGRLLVKLADAYEAAQKWGEANREVIRAGDLLPNDPAVQLRAAAAMSAAGRFVDAVDRLAPMLKASPRDPSLLMHMGIAEAKLGTPGGVLWQMTQVWRTRASFESVRDRLRGATTKAEDAAAEKHLRMAVELSPKAIDPHLALASFLWAADRVDEGSDVLKAAAERAWGHGLLNGAIGAYYEYRGNLVEAEEYLKIAAAGNDRDAGLGLADFYFRLDRTAEAVAILEPLAANAAEDRADIASLRLAEAYLRLDRNADALKRAGQVLAKDPNNAVALRVRATALLKSGDPKLALAVAREAVAASPASRDARLELALALETSGDHKSAFDEYSQAWQSDMRDPAVAKALARVAFALGRFGVAVDLASQSLRLKPGDADAAVTLARGHIALGNFSAADRALAPFAGKAASPGILALEGKVLAARGNVEAARAAFMKVLQLDHDSIDALDGLVELEIKAGQAARVRPQLEQALAGHAKDPAYLLLSAKLATAEKNFPRAEQALRAILESDGAHEDAALRLASLLADQGRIKEAQGVVEKSLERIPTSLRVRMKLGEVLELQGLQSESQAQYEKVISDNQQSGATTDMLDAINTASARLAALFANQGIRLDQALQLASAAKKYRPNDPLFSDTLGWVNVRKDRARVGLPYLESAVSADPSNPLFRYHLGVAYEQLGEFARARSELTRAVQGNPRYPGVEDARALLKTIGK